MKNSYPPLVKTNQEPEYKTSPPLKISSVSTEIKKNSSVMPDGSALLTNTGSNSSLKIQGIDYIIHAVPKMRSGCGSDEEFIEIAVKAAQNSIILADREGIKSLAICFVGGEIYRGSCDPQKLAEGIIRGVINQIEKVNGLEKISLIDWKGNSRHYLLEKTIELWKAGELPVLLWEEDETIFNSLAFNPKGNRNIIVKAGDICDKSTHGAEAIVNSENAQMNWGGGISGAIGRELGTEVDNVDQQRKELMKEFNSLINNQQPKNNEEKISSLFRFVGRGPSITDSEGNHTSFFFPHDTKPGEIVKKSIEIRNNHPTLVKHGSHQFWKIPENQNDYKVVKLTWYKAKEDKKLFEKGDFIEIEKIENDDKDKKSASEWQAELKEIDSKIGQVFNESKVKEWKEQGKFGRVEKVKELIKNVKDNSQLLNLIKTKLNSDSLEKIISDKTASEVITVIKRFEFDSLSQLDKEIIIKKIRKHFNLGENYAVTDKQINEYCYKLAIGKINEQEQEQNTINPENNILKYLGISALIPLSLLFAFFVRKRKKY